MYYIYLNNTQYGPYTEDQMRAMITAGKIAANTQVYKQGVGQQWLPASNYPELHRPPGKQAGKFVIDPLSSIPVGGIQPGGAGAMPGVPGGVERIIWEGRPSNLTIITTYIKYGLILLCVLGMYVGGMIMFLDFRRELTYALVGILIVILLRIGWIWLTLKGIKWTLTTERLTHIEGIFSRKTQNMELFRIKDLTLREPFFLHLFGHGYVDLITTDQTDLRLSIGAVKQPKDLYEMFRKYTERQRAQHHIVGFDRV